jgi:hypothetical protein
MEAFNVNYPVSQPLADNPEVYSWMTVRAGQPSHLNGVTMHDTIDMQGNDILNAPGGGAIPVDGDNVGTGCDIFKEKDGNILKFHRVGAGSSKVLVDAVADSCNVDVVQTELQVSQMKGTGLDGLMYSNGTAISALRSNLAAAVPPSVTDDANSNYSVGSRWINTVTDNEFVCLDNTIGAAKWISTTDGATGEANTSSSAGGTSLVLPKSASDLPFKGLTAGSNITLTPNANDIEIAATDTGEVNTASSAGGTSLVLPKSASDLPFKGLTAGSNITLTPNANDIEISAAAGVDTVNADCWDAIVDGVGTDGLAYANLQAAVTAGHKNICLKASSAGATLTDSTDYHIHLMRGVDITSKVLNTTPGSAGNVHFSGPGGFTPLDPFNLTGGKVILDGLNVTVSPAGLLKIENVTDIEIRDCNFLDAANSVQVHQVGDALVDRCDFANDLEVMPLTDNTEARIMNTHTVGYLAIEYPNYTLYDRVLDYAEISHCRSDTGDISVYADVALGGKIVNNSCNELFVGSGATGLMNNMVISDNVGTGRCLWYGLINTNINIHHNTLLYLSLTVASAVWSDCMFDNNILTGGVNGIQINATSFTRCSISSNIVVSGNVADVFPGISLLDDCNIFNNRCGGSMNLTVTTMRHSNISHNTMKGDSLLDGTTCTECNISNNNNETGLFELEYTNCSKCTYTGNVALICGVRSIASGTLVGCVLSNNVCTNLTVGHALGTGSATDDCIVSDNRVRANLILNGQLTDSIITNNTCDALQYGSGSVQLLNNCQFLGNTVANSIDLDAITIMPTNCTFSNNSAADISLGATHATNNKLYDNVASLVNVDQSEILATQSASNVGTGAGQVFKQKSTYDLQLKTIKAGTNITVNNNADDIEIIAAAVDTVNAECWDAIVDGVGTDGLAYANLSDAVDAGARNICVKANTAGDTLPDSTDLHIHVMRGVDITTIINNTTPGSAGNIKISGHGRITQANPFHLTGGSLIIRDIEFSGASVNIDNVENLELYGCNFSSASSCIISYLGNSVVDSCKWADKLNYQPKTNNTTLHFTHNTLVGRLDVNSPSYVADRTLDYINISHNTLTSFMGIYPDCGYGAIVDNTLIGTNGELYFAEGGPLNRYIGFTVTNNRCGHGINFYNSPIIDKFNISDNVLGIDAAQDISIPATATLSNSIISNNRVGRDIDIRPVSMTYSQVTNNVVDRDCKVYALTMTECVISGNKSNNNMTYGQSATGSLTDCKICDNTCRVTTWIEAGTFDGCDITNNTNFQLNVTASGGSGTIVDSIINDNNSSGANLLVDYIAMSESQVSNNMCSNGGIAVGSDTGTGSLTTNCLVNGNSTLENLFGRFTGCLVSNNLNRPGENINLDSGTTQLVDNCTFVGNRCTNIAVTLPTGKTIPTNCMFSGNDLSGGFVFGDSHTANNKIFDNTGATFTNVVQSEILGAQSASNVGAGAGQVFKQKTLYDLQLKTIKAGAGITVTNNTDDVEIVANPIVAFGNACHATNYNKTIDGTFSVISDNSATSIVSGMNAVATGLDITQTGKYMVCAVVSIDVGSNKDIEFAFAVNGVAQACRVFDTFNNANPGETSLSQIVDITVSGHDVEIMALSATSSSDVIRSWSLTAQYLGA